MQDVRFGFQAAAADVAGVPDQQLYRELMLSAGRGAPDRPDDGRVMSNFIVQALRGQPLTIHGDGSQTRSLNRFCNMALWPLASTTTFARTSR